MSGPWKSYDKDEEPEFNAWKKPVKPVDDPWESGVKEKIPETQLWKKPLHKQRAGKKLAAIGFDLGETLIYREGLPLNWHEHYPNALEKSAEICCIKKTPSLIVRGIQVLEKYNTRINPRKREVHSDDVFRELLEAAGYSTHDFLINKFSKAYFDYFLQEYTPHEGVVRALEELKERGYQLGILSDVPFGQKPALFNTLVASIPDFPGLFDVILSSVETGWRKPAIQAFLSLAKKLRTRASVMAYVGNEEKDMRGAKDAGMIAILFDRNNKNPAWGQNYRIANFSELPELLKKINES